LLTLTFNNLKYLELNPQCNFTPKWSMSQLSLESLPTNDGVYHLGLSWVCYKQTKKLLKLYVVFNIGG